MTDPNTAIRSTHLCQQIATLSSVDEAHGFREQLKADGEQMTSDVYAALLARIDVLRKREARG